PMCAARPDRAMHYALIATVTSVLGGILGWAVGVFAFSYIAVPVLDFYGKREAFERLSGETGEGAILLMLITSGLSHIPPMKVVTILSGVVHFNLWLFIASAIVARGARFYALAWLLRRYGTPILDFIERRFAWVALAAGIALTLLYLLVTH